MSVEMIRHIPVIMVVIHVSRDVTNMSVAMIHHITVLGVVRYMLVELKRQIHVES